MARRWRYASSACSQLGFHASYASVFADLKAVAALEAGIGGARILQPTLRPQALRGTVRRSKTSRPSAREPTLDFAVELGIEDADKRRRERRVARRR
jgi:hypothetical protein